MEKFLVGPEAIISLTLVSRLCGSGGEISRRESPPSLLSLPVGLIVTNTSNQFGSD